MTDEALIVYDVKSCTRGDFYDRSALFDSWPEACAAMQAELHDGREVLVERITMPRSEWEALVELDGPGLFQYPTVGV